MSKPRLRLTPEQLCQVSQFVELERQAKHDDAKWRDSYRVWWRGGHSWGCLAQGGVGQMVILYWYHHVHRPGSKEWRPAIIIKALLDHLKTNDHVYRHQTEGCAG